MAVVDSLSTNALDLPFALWYTTSRGSSSESGSTFNLSGSIGVPASHPSAPSTFTLFPPSGSSHSGSGSTAGLRSPRARGDSMDTVPASRSFLRELRRASANTSGLDGSCPWPIQEAIETRSPVRLDCSHLVDGVERRAWDMSATEVRPSLTHPCERSPQRLTFLYLLLLRPSFYRSSTFTTCPLPCSLSWSSVSTP